MNSSHNQLQNKPRAPDKNQVMKCDKGLRYQPLAVKSV